MKTYFDSADRKRHLALFANGCAFGLSSGKLHPGAAREQPVSERSPSEWAPVRDRLH